MISNKNFEKLVYDNAKKKYVRNFSENIVKRISKELEIFKRLNMYGFLFLNFELVRFFKKNKICIYSSQGAVSSSVVNYCLGLTDIDPISHNLIFERANFNKSDIPDFGYFTGNHGKDIIINYLMSKLFFLYFDLSFFQKGYTHLLRIFKSNNKNSNKLFSFNNKIKIEDIL